MMVIAGMAVDGYVRVSEVGYRKGERFISPQVQRDQILAWARAREVRVLEVFEELDESGGRARRPLLELAVQRVEQRVSRGIVTARVDRFGRTLLDGLLTIERIKAAGGGFWSVQDGFDIDTDVGRFVLRIMLSMAELELDRLRASWDEARKRAVARGTYASPWVPVGYRKTRAGRLRPDPVAGPVVAEVFRRRAAGETLSSLGRFMEAEGLLTGKGNPGWVPGSVARVLGNRTYLGELRNGQYHRVAAHPALIDGATWQAAQHPKRQLAKSSAVEPALLAGMVRCAGCGMTLPSVPRRGFRHYSCKTRFSAGRCPAPAHIAASLLDPYVEGVVFDLLRRRRRPPQVQVRSVEAEVSAAQESLAAYRDSDRVRRLLGEATYADGLMVRVERLRQAQLALADGRARLAAHDLPPIGDVRAAWPTMSRTERRELIARVIDMVFVAQGHLRPEQRVTVCPAGTGPSGLPMQGGKSAPLRSLKPRRAWVNPKTRR